jgi:hypothetical protein
MNANEAARYLVEVVNPRIIQLGDIVSITARHMRNEMSAEVAMHEIAVILEMRNK